MITPLKMLDSQGTSSLQPAKARTGARPEQSLSWVACREDESEGHTPPSDFLEVLGKVVTERQVECPGNLARGHSRVVRESVCHNPRGQGEIHTP